jgi:acetoacetyl-CoA synthetase
VTPDAPLWSPSPERVAGANITQFRRYLRQKGIVDAADYAALFDWTVRDPERFWSEAWEYFGIVGERGARIADRPFDMRPGAHYFPDAALNFTANVLRRADDQPAIMASDERGGLRTLSWGHVTRETAAFARALKAAGVGRGDRVAGILPNIPEAVIAALGAAAIGAVWSSCSPDFGAQGVLDRFGQIEPKVLVSVNGYYYGRRTFTCTERTREIVRALPAVERVVVVPHADEADCGSGTDVPGALAWNAFLEPHRGATLECEPLPFNHPLYVMYSSGTTGVPKCIVHGAGGTLIQHLKEHRLHCDIKPGDRVFYFTTCGWMMWNWLVTALASSATLVLYDGSAMHRDGAVLFDLADRAGMTLFGTSAKYIDTLAKAGLEPMNTHALTTLRTMTTTGSPLAPESFDFVFGHIKRDIHLASISGGTDIISCFVGGNPAAPVWRGEIQACLLGMNVQVFDEAGRSLQGGKGELVCTQPFPSMPVAFWNDPDGRKYRAAYFERFPGVWTHGDYTELTAHGGVIIYGRSDAVLNPGGVRIGTAEIYRQVEQLPEIIESLAIGQQWGGDERVVLFVRLRDGVQLDEPLRERIRQQIRRNATPRHVPARIVQVADIPRTRSGKIVELAVRDVVHGRDVKNKEALANPDALEQFRDRAELHT